MRGIIHNRKRPKSLKKGESKMKKMYWLVETNEGSVIMTDDGDVRRVCRFPEISVENECDAIEAILSVEDDSSWEQYEETAEELFLSNNECKILAEYEEGEKIEKCFVFVDDFDNDPEKAYNWENAKNRMVELNDGLDMMHEDRSAYFVSFINGDKYIYHEEDIFGERLYSNDNLAWDLLRRTGMSEHDIKNHIKLGVWFYKDYEEFIEMNGSFYKENPDENPVEDFENLEEGISSYNGRTYHISFAQ